MKEFVQCAICGDMFGGDKKEEIQVSRYNKKKKQYESIHEWWCDRCIDEIENRKNNEDDNFMEIDENEEII